MSDVAERMFNDAGELRGLRIDCPGCRRSHIITLPNWTWNGSTERPTLSPSLLVYPATGPDGKQLWPRCHSFVRDGSIQFLGDCDHALAGQTVPLPAVAEKILWGDEGGAGEGGR